MNGIHADLKKTIIDTVREYNGDTVIMSGEAYHKMCWQFSALYEGLKNQVKTLEAQAEIMSGYVSEYLEFFEMMYENDEGIFDCKKDEMQKYITIATFMERKYQRPSLAKRVKERMDQLPF